MEETTPQDTTTTPIDEDYANGLNSEDQYLRISPDAERDLDSTRKWTMFFSILGFFFIGLMVIVALSIGSLLSQFGQATSLPLPGAALSFIYLVFAGLYVMPVYYLYKYSTHMKAAIRHKDELELQSAFSNLKSHYKFVGIMMCIVLGFYAVILLGAGVGAALS